MVAVASPSPSASPQTLEGYRRALDMVRGRTAPRQRSPICTALEDSMALLVERVKAGIDAGKWKEAYSDLATLISAEEIMARFCP